MREYLMVALLGIALAYGVATVAKSLIGNSLERSAHVLAQSQ